MNKVTEIVESLTGKEGGDKELCELVEKDLDIKVDWECSCLIDKATGKSLNVSFEDIVKAVKNRMVVYVNSFCDENYTSTNTERAKCPECGGEELEYINVECQECGYIYSCNASPVS